MKLTKASSDYINSLRAISSQVVLIGHIVAIAGIISSKSLLYELPSYAVLIFFLLSGFVISYSVSQKNMDYGFKNYFIDRFSRIYIALVPALFLTIIIALLSTKIFGTTLNNVSPQLFACDLLMQQDNPVLMQLSSIFMLKTRFIGFFGEIIGIRRCSF